MGLLINGTGTTSYPYKIGEKIIISDHIKLILYN